MKRTICVFLAFCTVFLSGCNLLPFSLDFPMPWESTAPESEAGETTESTTAPVEIPETTLPAQTTEVTTETTEATEPGLQWPEDAPYLPLYWDAINDFKTLLAFRLSKNWDADDDPPDLSETMETCLDSADEDRALGWDYMLFELGDYGDYRLKDFGYVLYDINNDKVPELFWVYRDDHTIAAVFTVYKEKLQLLDVYWSRYCGYISDNGQYHTYGSSGAADSETVNFILNKGKFQEVFCYGIESRDNADGYGHYEETSGQKHDISDARNNALHNSFSCADGYFESTKVYNLDHVPEKGDGGASKSSKVKYLPYKQKIKRADQSVYRGPGRMYDWLGTTEEAGTFTIVSEIKDEEGHLWGKLKSGKGWVDLTEVRKSNNETLRITANFADPDLLESNKYYFCSIDETDYSVNVAIYAYEKLTNITVSALVMSGETEYWEDRCCMDALDSKKPLVLLVDFPGPMSCYKITFTDSKGVQYSYLLSESGENGDIVLMEDQ